MFLTGDINNDEHLDRLIEAIRGIKNKTQEEYSVADIIHGIKKGELQFLINREAICIWYFNNEFYTNKKIFFIFLFYCLQGNALERYLPYFADLAKQLDCLKLEWSSNRLGYIRRLDKLPRPVKIKSVDYSLDLNN